MLVLLQVLTAAAEVAKSPIDTALVFVMDTSASMSADELRLARDSHSIALRSSDVIAAVQSGDIGRSAFAYVEFSTAAKVQIGWMLVHDMPSADAFAQAIERLSDSRSPKGFTNIGAGLIAARHLFESLPWKANRLVIDVVGDGIENSSFSFADARNHLLDMGVVINGMPLLISPSTRELDVYYLNQIIGAPGAFSVPLYDIDEMPTLLRQKIVMELF